MITALLFLYVGGSAYAECIVDGTSYDVGGTGVTTVDRSNPITLAIIRDDWDTSGDDITTCDVSNITDMTNMFKDEDAFNQDIGKLKLLVPKRRLELPHTCVYMNLNHARLPIPPLRHLITYRYITNDDISSVINF